MARRYLTTDVFTDQPFGGNPLAVVLEAEGLTTAAMQAIAAEFNYSETAFVLPPRDARHHAHVRIFTPRAEVPFAGHPNVGTAYVLGTMTSVSASAATDTLVFEEAAGEVPVTLVREQNEIVGAEFLAPERLSRRAVVSREIAAECLGLAPHDIAVETHVPQIVSVGLPFLVVEVASREALGRARGNLAAHEALFPLDEADAVFAYTHDSAARAAGSESVLHARMFAPLDGVPEDPATGSATGATIALLTVLDDAASAERIWRVHQGEDMGRPSLLLGRTHKQDGEVTAVQIGGRCVLVMEGSIRSEVA